MLGDLEVAFQVRHGVAGPDEGRYPPRSDHRQGPGQIVDPVVLYRFHHGRPAGAAPHQGEVDVRPGRPEPPNGLDEVDGPLGDAELAVGADDRNVRRQRVAAGHRRTATIREVPRGGRDVETVAGRVELRR